MPKSWPNSVFLNIPQRAATASDHKVTSALCNFSWRQSCSKVRKWDTLQDGSGTSPSAVPLGGGAILFVLWNYRWWTKAPAAIKPLNLHIYLGLIWKRIIFSCAVSGWVFGGVGIRVGEVEGQHLVLTLCENEQTLLRKSDRQAKQQWGISLFKGADRSTDMLHPEAQERGGKEKGRAASRSLPPSTHCLYPRLLWVVFWMPARKV